VESQVGQSRSGLPPCCELFYNKPDFPGLWQGNRQPPHSSFLSDSFRTVESSITRIVCWHSGFPRLSTTETCHTQDYRDSAKGCDLTLFAFISDHGPVTAPCPHVCVAAQHGSLVYSQCNLNTSLVLTQLSTEQRQPHSATKV